MPDKVFNDILDKEQENIFNTLKEIIAIPSIAVENSDGDTPFGKPCAEVLDKFLKTAENMGFKTHNYENYAGTIDYGDGEPILGILCHLDVVPVTPSEWTTPPFEANIRDGKIFGRGAIDDKGPATGVLYAFKILKKAGVKLKHNVRFIVGCDEENGSADMEYFRKHASFPKYVFTPDGDYPVINFEKGMLRVKFTKNISGSRIIAIKGGNIINAVPSTAYAKLSDGTEIKINGKEAHASTPDKGENALAKLVKYIVDNKTDNNIVWTQLAELFPYGDNHGKGMGIYSNDEKTGDTTCVWSVAEINNDILTGYFDVRFPANVKKDEIIEKIKNKFEEYSFESEFLLAEDYHSVPAESPFVKSLLEVYEAETGKKGEPIAIGGGTYVHDIEGGVAFGAEFPGDNNNMHSRNESITISKLNMNIKLFISAILKICGEESRG